MNDLALELAEAIRVWSNTRPRSLASSRGHIGISDIGGCRQYVRYLTIGEKPSDIRDTWPADVGTAIDYIVKEAVNLEWGEAVDTDHKVVCHYPNGAEVPGTPDIVLSQLVVDVKTKDGLATVKRSGPTNQNWWQVMGYAQGLLADGTFTEEEDITVAVAFLDRSGASTDIPVFERDYDPAILSEAADWIDDVTYAVQHGEEAPRDWPINKCERYCEFFTTCRGETIAPEGGLIEHPETLDAIDRYVEASALEKEAKALKSEARADLEGIDGSTGTHTVRWTQVNEADIPGYTRNGYTKLDVRAVKKAK